MKHLKSNEMPVNGLLPSLSNRSTLYLTDLGADLYLINCYEIVSQFNVPYYQIAGKPALRLIAIEQGTMIQI
jgi:hypothetical protein